MCLQKLDLGVKVLEPRHECPLDVFRTARFEKSGHKGQRGQKNLVKRCLHESLPSEHEGFVIAMEWGEVERGKC